MSILRRLVVFMGIPMYLQFLDEMPLELGGPNRLSTVMRSSLQTFGGSQTLAVLDSRETAIRAQPTPDWMSMISKNRFISSSAASSTTCH